MAAEENTQGASEQQIEADCQDNDSDDDCVIIAHLQSSKYQNIFHYDSDEDLRLVFPSDSEEPIVISTDPRKLSEPPTDINENIFETLTISTPHKKHCSGTGRNISEATDLSRPVEDELLEANSESNQSCLEATDLSRPVEDELLEANSESNQSCLEATDLSKPVEDEFSEANSESNQSCLESSVWRPWEQTEPAKEDSYSSDEGSIIIDLHSEICRPISRSSDVVKQDIDSQGRADEGSVDHELQSEGASEQQIEADCQDNDSDDDCVIIAHFQSSKHNIRRAFEQIKQERQDSGSDEDCVIIDEIQSNKHKSWRASKQIIPYWQDSSPGNDGVVLAKIQSQQKEMDSDYFTQTPSTARGSQRQSVSCRTAGTIHKIQMRNFMCHDNLEVELNPRINFIIGKNGSGKSAIQTAIAVGLGCKALATNRGSSIKALIKNDKTSCTISIAINNQGESAYKPDVYGPYIKVERMFSQTGGSYKIKDSSGKVVSEQKRELDRIVNHFNIQPENPLCILQQDTARNFLNSSDPKKKYTFYMKASRLGDISNLYNESVSKVIVVKDVLESKFQSVAEAFHDVLEMKKKIKIMEDARSKRDKCANLEKELLWAEVNERKVELKKLQKKYEMHNENMKNLLQQLKELQENNGAEKLRELESQLREMDEMVEDARKNLESAKQKYLEEKDKYAHSVSKFKETKESKRSKKYKYDSCLTEIEKLVKSAPEIQQKQERLKAELNSHREELTALKAAETTAEHDRQQLNDTADVTRQNLQSCEQTLSSLKTRKGKTADQIKRLNQSSNNLSIYGDHIAAIVEEVERAARQGKFSQKPIGPIGTHISVRDQQWAAAVEHFLQKGFLSTFCVDNPKDSAVLSNIMKSVCSRYRAAQPSIICSKFLNRMHNIRESESVTEQYRNLVRALDIDHPVVANCLIDQMEAETVLLIPTNGEAYQLLDEAHKVPRNCKRAFTLTGDQFVPAPNYKSYSAMRPVTRATLLQAKQEDLIREFTNEIKKLTEDIGKAEREKQILQKQLGDISTSMRKNEQELRNIKKRRRDIEDRMRRIGEEISDSENQTNIGFLEEESQELKRHYESESLKCEELKTACEEAKAKFEAARADFENHQSTIEESNRQKAPVLSEIQRLRSIMQQATSKAENINCQLREQKSRAERIESRIKEVEEELAVTRENASQSCEEEVETNRSKEEIEQELNILRTYLQSLEAELGGSIEVLQDSLRQRQRAFDVVTKSLNDLRSLLKKTNESLKQRRKKQELLQRIMMSSAKHNFQIALKERNFEGKLEFDMEQETLQIKVSRPQSSGQSEKRLETSSLSGGEKSYSTVCFIMALWHEIELPFHFMDEFDVFMDGINRKTVIDMLLGHARNINQQFVFLTPLDASCIPEDDNITIHRLAAPRQ